MQITYLVHKCLQMQRYWRPSILVLNRRNGNVTLTFRSGSFSLTLQKTIFCWLPPLDSLSPPLRPPNSQGNGGFSGALPFPLPQKLENKSSDQKAKLMMMEAQEVSGSDRGVHFSWLSVQLVRQRHWASGPTPELRMIKDPEVSVESKEIRFSGKHKMGPRHLSACCRKDNRRYIHMQDQCDQGGQTSHPGNTGNSHDVLTEKTVLRSWPNTKEWGTRRPSRQDSGFYPSFTYYNKYWTLQKASSE